MAATKITYGTSTSLAITSLNSLASDTAVGLLVACSVAVTNTATLALDYNVSLTVTYPNSAPTVAYLTCFYASYDGNAWSDDGYGDAPDGTDQTITIGSPTCLRFAGTVPVLQNKVTAAASLLSVASVFGLVPPQWSLVVHNGSGQAIAASTNSARYQAITADTA